MLQKTRKADLVDCSLSNPTMKAPSLYAHFLSLGFPVPSAKTRIPVGKGQLRLGFQWAGSAWKLGRKGSSG